MAFSKVDYATKTINPAQGHHQLASRFPDPLDCLTAHLMLECSEVLAGVKPANLISSIY